MRRLKDTAQTKEEMLLSVHGQKKLLFYAQILDEIADYYTCKDSEIRICTDRQDLWLDKLQLENGKIMEGQLKDISLLLKNMAKESYKVPTALEKCKYQILKKLKENDLLVEEAYVMEYPNGRMEVGICCHARVGDYYSTQEMVDFITTITKRRMVMDKDSVLYIHDEPVLIVCREELNYQLFYNVARATKTGEILSGDNFLIQEYPEGTTLFVLSDGMGSGEEACDDSTVVVELFDKLREAGVSMEEAARQVNDVLCMRTRKLRTASLDCCQLNLCTGEGSLLKCGAAPTYIKRGSQVVCREFQTLPLGIMQGEKGREETFYFQEGDVIVLVSDGITDVFEDREEEAYPRKETGLEDFLAQIDSRKPKELANQILGMAIKMDEGRIRDDMTVLVGVVMER